MAAGYRRETLMLRAPGGARMGFVVWERGARQGSLRCHIEGLIANQRYRLLWVSEEAFALGDCGEIRSDADGAAGQTLLLAGEVPLIGVVLAREDGVLCAQAFVNGRESGEPERLQALLHTQWEPPAPRKQPASHKQPAPQNTAQAVGGTERPREEEATDSRQIEAARQGCAPAWPPPPGLPGAVWRAGRWAIIQSERL